MTGRTRWALVDLGAVLLLVGITELALARTFDGWGYLALGEAGAVLGLLVVLVTARLPGAVLVGAVPLAAFVLAGPLAMRADQLADGIPDPASVPAVLAGTWTAWGELLTTLPWVDLDGPPALVPFLLGYAGAVAAGVLALRTRRVGAPVLPLVVVLAIALLLRRPGGTGFTLLDWYPIAFAVVAVGWLVVRGIRVAPGADARGAGHGRVGRALAAGVVLAAAFAVAVPLTVPLTESGTPASAGTALRGREDALTDYSDLDSPLRRFRTFTEQEKGSLDNVHKQVLFTVTGAPAGSRVRMVTYDRYDGQEWQPAGDTGAPSYNDTFLHLDSRVDNPLRGERVAAQINLSSAYRSAWVPTIGSLTSMRLLFPDPREERRALLYNLATATAVLPNGLSSRQPYEFTAVVPPSGVGKKTPAWAGAGLEIVGLDRVTGFLPAVVDAPISPMQKVFVLAGFLHDQGRYSDGAEPGEQQYLAGHDIDRLMDGFLLSDRPVGNDEQYASAMALLANRVGVPARVVVGATLPRNGKVRGQDVHAWVELRVADGSWRVLPTRAFMGNTPPTRSMPPLPRDVPSRPERPSEDTPPQTRGDAQGTTDQQTGARAGSWLRVVPLAVALVLALVVPLVKVVRRRRRRTHGRAADRMAGAWTELVDHARDLGVPVAVHASRPAQARVLAGSRTAGLSREADDGVFGPLEPSDAAVTAYWDQVMAERRELRSGRRLVRRAWAPFNPASLRRGGRRD